MRKGLVTTNEQKPTGQGEPQKLNIITTSIIPNAVPQPEPKGTGFEKMITTHDIEDEVILRAKEETNRFEGDLVVEVEVGKAIPLDEPTPEPAPKKKAGRLKKA